MTRLRFPALAFAAAALVLPAARGQDDAAAARAIVAKALKAHGGADTLAKYKAHVVTFKGTFHGMGAAIPMSGTISSEGADKIKADIDVEAGGQTFKVVNVVAGDKGWAKLPGMDTKDMSKDELDEGREQAHAGWVATLAPLAGGKGYTLAAAGEQLVNDKAAVGVRVSAKGRRDVTLYFDKATHLLVRYETVVKDEGSGREVTEETFQSEYKDVQGTKQATKFVTKRDGKLFLEGESTEHSLSESLGDGVFVKP
jgi:hypothetical protein